MLLLLAACDVPATAWPVDPCRIGAAFDTLSADVTCAAAGHTVEATFENAGVTRVGGVQGEGWEGLSFYATGATTDGGTLSVGLRDGGVGVYARDATFDVVAGFLPASADLPDAPYVSATEGDTTCDAAAGAGTVTLRGLPEEWAEGGEWEMSFDAGSYEADAAADAWAPSWGDACPLSPAAWASVRVSAACDGAERAAIQFLAPAAYTVELDALGQVGAASATWASAFSAVCDGGVLPSLAGSLQAEDGAIRLYTPVLTVTRDAEGAWALEEAACGECDGAWVVTVTGLPDL